MEGMGKPAKKDVFGFFDATKPWEYDAGGKQVVCVHCGGTTFTEGATDAHTMGKREGFFDVFDMVFTLACTHCGYVQWFLKRPKRRPSQAQERTQPPKA